MDVFVIAEQDPHQIVKKMAEVGIHSVYESSVKASGVTWFEEEGIYIRLSKLVVALVDEELLADECDAYALNYAKNCRLSVYALLQGATDEVEAAFSSRYHECEVFSDPNKLLSAIMEFQITHRTGSGLSVKADMYFRAALYDEALSVCKEYLEYATEELQHLSGLPAVQIKKDVCTILEMVACIYFIRRDYEKVETALRKQIAVVEDERVIWGTDHLLYARHLLLTFYTAYYPDRAKEEELRGLVEGKQCFGFDEQEAQRQTDKMLQRVLLYFERCTRLLHRYEEEQSDKRETPTDNIHKLIAEHIETSILLFNELAKQGVPLGFGECLSTGYERLMEYCRIIGERKLAVRCLDAIAANVKVGHMMQAKENEEAMLNLKCIKAYLGQTQPDSGNYDAFISHRAADTEMAMTVYTLLRAKGKETFLDRVSLPVLGDSEYRNSILEAIDNSAHLILVSSGVDFFDSKWVKEECNMFCDEKREGRKSGNLVMVFPRSVCNEIFAANKRNLPIQLRSFEIIALEDIEKYLLQYIV